MIRTKQLLFPLLILLLSFSALTAQEEQENEEKVESEDYKHGINFLVTHSYISQGKIDGKREYIAAPSFGINYYYIINEKWAIGLHNDIIIESFQVENPSIPSESLERELPISNLIMGTYEVRESFAVSLGGGVEWEKNENFAVIRLGFDYGLELNNKGLEMVFTFNYDNLIDAYDSINFGIGLAKLF